MNAAEMSYEDIRDVADAIAEKYGRDTAARWMAAFMSWSAADQAAFEAEKSTEAGG